MIRHKFYMLTSLILLTLAITSSSYAQSKSPVLDLFDGKTLDGWKSNPQYWRVENGAIVGEIPKGETLGHNTWAVWNGQLTDFELQLQVKLTGAPGANSGIQFRCQVDNVNHVSGYQADLDKGATWLGRIYDEHGRALLVERGSRVAIAADGTRTSEIFAPANQYAVLFRENAWNDYRIVAIGEHVAIYINGTLFSELQDRQIDQQDLSGSLAFQLHSGPETRVEFRNVRLEILSGKDSRLGKFEITAPSQLSQKQKEDLGFAPKSATGEDLNLGFEKGNLSRWTATGDAFKGQPINKDGIGQRRAGQQSNKNGNFFIGGYELVQDGGTGTLTSSSFTVNYPYATFLIGGGNIQASRIEIIQPATDKKNETVIFTAIGKQHEPMHRVMVDLQKIQGQQIAIRLVDESTIAWGHLNFDDFRFHKNRPANIAPLAALRSLKNPLLHHLLPNPVESDKSRRGSETTKQMHVPAGFSVDVIAAEPQVHQPMAFTFDAKGRLWVVEGHSYPQKRPEGEGLDRILIFSDENGDGSFETRKVFIEGLNLVSGLEVGYGGVWVGAAPDLLFIPDANGDDQPDSEPQILLDGFGYGDTHETLNSFIWGPDGWLYGNQGVFNSSNIGKPGTPQPKRQRLSAGVWRYHPTRHVFEIFAHGGSNQWGLDFNEFGQLFMTHCRSYWGKGSTTHVVQNGHYWNQVNGGYAPYISSTSLPHLPAMKNYMLASARYGHGEGGAGKPGSRQVYGGHSHVGTMIYLGDNWPATYRNHLFTHNLHGHRLNHQVNIRQAGGYNTLHAGYDVLFCPDEQYIGVDLKYGPDGAVYISDWYDPRHCHNPNIEQWDRGNGRMYRMKYDATYQPVKVDYTQATDEELVAAQLHENDWHVRMARMVLSERFSAKGTISDQAIKQLLVIATTHKKPARRLRAVWALNAVGEFDAKLAARLLKDDSEYIRAWSVQLAVEALPQNEVASLLEQLVKEESSLLVRRYLACAIPRLPAETGWKLAEAMNTQPENMTDRELPLLLWYGVAGLMPNDLNRALKLSDKTALPVMRDYIHWYAAKLSNQGRDAITQRLADADQAERFRLISLLEMGIRGMRGLPEPSGWSEVSASLYDSPQLPTRRTAEILGAAFGDTTLFARMRTVLAEASSDINMKRHALTILANDSSPENLPLFIRQINTKELTLQVLPLLARYDNPSVASELVARLTQWGEAEKAAAMEVLASRVSWAKRVLEAIAKGDLEKNQLTAYYARQMSNFSDESLNQLLSQQWGRLSQSSEERKAEMEKLARAYKIAPLWAFDANKGAEHFKKLCIACHEPNKQNERIAPKLAGSGSKGIDYIIENIIDPNAVIGRDFQARIILTVEGRVITGLVEKETDSAITIRTATNSVTIAKDEIEETSISEASFMPESLLKTLNDRQKIELLKYLMSL